VTPGFRADIEGLRALAILLVVSAHAGLLGLKGGFVGVDVFFVLSGYLITAQLLQEQRQTGSTALFAFYARRIRRLLPAALLVLAASLWLAWVFYPPSARQAQALSAASAAVWLSNFHFALADLDYFGSTASGNLFLHTWSLSVEEQFYLFWPLLLLGLARAAPQHRERLWRAGLCAVFALGLIGSLRLSSTQPLLGFYLMPSRAWQFALGGLAWLLLADRRSTTSLATAAAASGLAMILAAGWLLHERLSYPGFWALLPSLGTALLLAAGTLAPQNRISRQLLGLPLAQWLGRHSYALYLWHWPLLLVGRDQLGLDTPAARLSLMLFAWALAAATHHLVEAPLRRWSLPLHQPARTVLMGLATALLAAAVILHLSRPPVAAATAAPPEVPAIYALGCDDWYHSAQLKVCAFGAEDAPHTAVAIGDSVGLQWFPALEVVFVRPGWRLLVMTKSACPLVDEPIFYARIGREYTECAAWRQSALEAIASLKPELVVWGSTDTYEYSPQQWTEGSASALAKIAPTSGKVVVLRSTPVLPDHSLACLEPRSALYQWLRPEDGCEYAAADPGRMAVYQALQTAAARFNNVSVLDLDPQVCPEGRCRAQRKGQRIYRDNRHLTAGFTHTLSGHFESHLLATLPRTAPP